MSHWTNGIFVCHVFELIVTLLRALRVLEIIHLVIVHKIIQNTLIIICVIANQEFEFFGGHGWEHASQIGGRAIKRGKFIHYLNETEEWTMYNNSS